MAFLTDTDALAWLVKPFVPRVGHCDFTVHHRDRGRGRTLYDLNPSLSGHFISGTSLFAWRGWREDEETLGWEVSPWKSATQNWEGKLEEDAVEESSGVVTIEAEAGSILRRMMAVR